MSIELAKPVEKKTRQKRASRFEPFSLQQFVFEMEGGTRAAVELLREVEHKDSDVAKFLKKLYEYPHDWRKLTRWRVICKEAVADPVAIRKALVKAKLDYVKDRAKMIQYERAEELVNASINAATKGDGSGTEERRAHLEKLEVVDAPKASGGVNIALNQLNAGGAPSFEQRMLDADRALRGGQPLALAGVVEGEIVEG